jgi:hypothetical protein
VRDAARESLALEDIGEFLRVDLPETCTASYPIFLTFLSVAAMSAGVLENSRSV